MATIIRKGKPEITDKEEVKIFLKDYGVEYDHWVVPASSKTYTAKQTLNDAEKEELLQYEFNCKIENQKLIEMQERLDLDTKRQQEYQLLLKTEMEKRDEELILVQEAGDDSMIDAERKMQDDIEYFG